MYELRCDRCGWNEIMDSVLYTSCPNCHNKLIIENDGEDNELANTILKEEDRTMEKQISKLGNDKMWNLIETLVNPIARASQRVVFLRNGGQVPKGKEINI